MLTVATKQILSETYRDILQWNDSTRLFVSRIFEVIQAVVIEDEPTSLPAFVSPALFPQPTFFVGVEERVHKIIAIVLRNFEGLGSDGLVQRLQQFSRQISTVVDASVHGDELLNGGLVFDWRIVQGSVQHDDGEAQHVTSVGVGENVGVQLTIALSEAFHHAVNFLRLSRQSKAPQKLPKMTKKGKWS